MYVEDVSCVATRASNRGDLYMIPCHTLDQGIEFSCYVICIKMTKNISRLSYDKYHEKIDHIELHTLACKQINTGNRYALAKALITFRTSEHHDNNKNQPTVNYDYHKKMQIRNI